MNLKDIRTQMNLTQKQLAEKMDTTQQTVARWENGKTPLNSAHIKQLCSVLHCTPQDLMGWVLDDEGFNGARLLEHGLPYGTLRLTTSFGVQEHPIGEFDREAVNQFIERRSVVNYQKEGTGWLAVTTLNRRLLLINPTSLRSVAIVSDDIEAMPGFQAEDYAPSGWDGGHEGLQGPGEDFCVTFIDGIERDYALTEVVANDVYSILIGHDVREGCFLTVQEDAGGALRSSVNLGHIAMLDIPAELFAALTTDTAGDYDEA